MKSGGKSKSKSRDKSKSVSRNKSRSKSKKDDKNKLEYSGSVSENESSRSKSNKRKKKKPTKKIKKKSVVKGIISDEENNIKTEGKKVTSEEQESSKQDYKDYKFVDINNIIGSKLDIDESDLKSFERSRITSGNKKNSKLKLSYNSINKNYYKPNTIKINKINKLYITSKNKIAKKDPLKGIDEVLKIKDSKLIYTNNINKIISENNDKDLMINKLNDNKENNSQNEKK